MAFYESHLVAGYRKFARQYDVIRCKRTASGSQRHRRTLHGRGEIQLNRNLAGIGDGHVLGEIPMVAAEDPRRLVGVRRLTDSIPRRRLKDVGAVCHGASLWLRRLSGRANGGYERTGRSNRITSWRGEFVRGARCAPFSVVRDRAIRTRGTILKDCPVPDLGIFPSVALCPGIRRGGPVVFCRTRRAGRSACGKPHKSETRDSEEESVHHRLVLFGRR